MAHFLLFVYSVARWPLSISWIRPSINFLSILRWIFKDYSLFFIMNCIIFIRIMFLTGCNWIENFQTESELLLVTRMQSSLVFIARPSLLRRQHWSTFYINFVILNPRKFHFTSPRKFWFCACHYVIFAVTGPDSSSGRASASGAGGRGFETRPRHTKGVKNGTSGYLAWRSAL